MLGSGSATVPSFSNARSSAISPLTLGARGAISQSRCRGPRGSRLITYQPRPCCLGHPAPACTRLRLRFFLAVQANAWAARAKCAWCSPLKCGYRRLQSARQILRAGATSTREPVSCTLYTTVLHIDDTSFRQRPVSASMILSVSPMPEASSCVMMRQPWSHTRTTSLMVGLRREPFTFCSSCRPYDLRGARC